MTADPQPPRVILRDVAAAANVSLATASKALNGRAEVRTETRHRVQAAARALGFSPTPPAPGFASPTRKNVFGLIVTDVRNRRIVQVIRGVEDVLGAASRAIMLGDSRDDRVRERYAIRTMSTAGVDGFIVVGPSTDRRDPITAPRNEPVVYALSPSTNPNDRSVVPDTTEAGSAAIRHLLSRGCRTIALINGPPDAATARSIACGADQQIKTTNLTLAGGTELNGEWTENWGRQAVTALLAAHPGTDGVIVVGDHIARGAIDNLRAAGKNIPRDVAVIGIDNVGEFPATAQPTLTVIDLELEELGRAAARLLLPDPDAPSLHPGINRVPIRLSPRASTATL